MIRAIFQALAVGAAVGLFVAAVLAVIVWPFAGEWPALIFLIAWATVGLIAAVFLFAVDAEHFYHTGEW